MSTVHDWQGDRYTSVRSRLERRKIQVQFFYAAERSDALLLKFADERTASCAQYELARHCQCSKDSIECFGDGAGGPKVWVEAPLALCLDAEVSRISQEEAVA